MPSRPWPWPWCGGWWLHQLLRDTKVSSQFDSIPSFRQHCGAGKIGSILVDAKTLLFVLNFQSVAFDVDLAEQALRDFLSVFPKTKLIFVFPVPGPNDGPNRRNAGNVPSDFTSTRFDGIEPRHEHEATQLEEMAHYRARRGSLMNGIEISGYDTVFFREWITQRLWRLGHEVFNIEGINDHSQQLAMMAKDMRCDYVLSTYPDFYLYDMGDTGYVQFRLPYPLGRCPVPVYRARDVARVLGIPLQGLHELSCLLGNHVMRPSVDEPLADFLDKEQEAIGGTREQVVKKFFDLTRKRWSDGRTYTLLEQATYLHELTGLDAKIMLNALKFYDIGNKRPNGATVVDFPLVGPPQARLAYLNQLGYSDVVTFRETRLRAQYGDSFIRRFHVLERLRALKYGLLMMSPRECCALDGRLDQLVTSTEHIVVEHRCDFSSAGPTEDTVRQYMVEAKIPKFTFFAAPGRAVDIDNLSPEPLFKAFENPRTVEFYARRSFFLNLFGANTAHITALPEVLQPTAAALRFLMQVNVKGIDNAVDAFIQHVVVLQHREQARVINQCQREQSRKRPSTYVDEQAFGYFFLITHVLYAALVEFNSLCNFPFAEIPAFEKTFDYRVFCVLFEQGSRMLSVQEIGEANSIHRAVTTGVRKHIDVDLGDHDSMWVPPPPGAAAAATASTGRGGGGHHRIHSAPVASSSTGSAASGGRRLSGARPRCASEISAHERHWRHRWSTAKLVLEPNGDGGTGIGGTVKSRPHAQSAPLAAAPVPQHARSMSEVPATHRRRSSTVPRVAAGPPPTVPQATTARTSTVPQRRFSVPRVAAGPPTSTSSMASHATASRTSFQMIPTRTPFASNGKPATMQRRRSRGDSPPRSHASPRAAKASQNGGGGGAKSHLSRADMSRNWRRSGDQHAAVDERNARFGGHTAEAAAAASSTRRRQASAPEPPRERSSRELQQQQQQPPQRAHAASVAVTLPSRTSKVTLITAPDFYDRDQEVVDVQREFMATITRAAAADFSKPKAADDEEDTEAKTPSPGAELRQKVQLITAPDFYDRDLEVVDREREFSTTLTSARGRKHSVFDVDHSVLTTETLI